MKGCLSLVVPVAFVAGVTLGFMLAFYFGTEKP